MAVKLKVSSDCKFYRIYREAIIHPICARIVKEEEEFPEIQKLDIIESFNIFIPENIEELKKMDIYFFDKWLNMKKKD